jgi:hypothetical protein
MKFIIAIIVILFTSTLLAILEEKEIRLKELDKMDQGEKESE